MEAYRHAGHAENELEPEIIRRARDLLAHSPYSEVRRVTSSYDRGVLMLRGRVSSRYIKQVAQELMGRIQGVHCLVNEIEVRAASESVPDGRGAGTAIPGHAAIPGASEDDDSNGKG